MATLPFRDRREAGQWLAKRLSAYAGRDDVVVLALPRGGVPVAFEVARAIQAPLDVFLVRKLGVPGHPEFAMGAIAAGGVRVLNQDVITHLGISPAMVEEVAERERAELERRDKAYHANRSKPSLRGKTVIVIDDGLATGSTMEAAVSALREYGVAKIVVAAPVGAPDSCDWLRALAGEVVCLETPEPFDAVGLWYLTFDQTSDEEVVDLLERARGRAAAPARAAGTTDMEQIRIGAVALDEESHDFDGLLKAIGSARIVLLGEASHGTHEFYRERAFITERLIAESGFSAVAVEADWPDAYRVNRYVRGVGDDPTANESLADFRRFPTWMWRNADVLDFVGWLRDHNDLQRTYDGKAGFYGLDLYSLYRSIEVVLAYLDKVDPEAARRARYRYSCFEDFDEDSQQYGYATSFGLSASCEREAIEQLVELQRTAAEYARRDGQLADDEAFFVEQNARLVANAERYYRTMFGGRVSSWNLRDRHMVETLHELDAHLSRGGRPAKIVVWAHNSHLGDARATEMSARGELNVGQLVRQRYGNDAVLVGFTTYIGTVTAASNWDAPTERKQVRPALN